MTENLPLFSPNGQRARDLKKEADLSLLGSLMYLLDVFQEGTQVEVKEEIQFLNDVAQLRNSAESQLSCMAYVFHDRFLSAIRLQNTEAARSLIREFSQFSWISNKPLVGPFLSNCHSPAEWRELGVTLSAAYRTEYQSDFCIKQPSNELTLKTVDVIGEALARISASDGESYDEFEALVTDIVLLASSGVVEGSCFNALGCIYLSTVEEHQSWVHLVDMIIHETAHHLLYTYWSKAPLILNDRQGLYNSPFRTEKRPLSGIYHAMCVLARTIRILKILERTDSFVNEIKIYYYNDATHSGVNELEKEFLATYEIIKRHADLSGVGKSIMEESREMALA